MDSINWNQEHKESPEDVERALAVVRQNGNRTKKRQTLTRVASVTTGTAAIAALALVVVFAGGPSNDAPIAAPPETSVPTTELPITLATKVIKTATSTLADTRSIVATEHTIVHPENPNHGASETMQSYRINNDGSYWSSTKTLSGRQNTDEVSSYSATSGVVIRCEDGGAALDDCWRLHGTDYPLYTSLFRFVSAVRSADGAEKLQASDTTVNGQSVWILEFDSHPVYSPATLHTRITVDQQTGFPIELVETADGKISTEATLTDLKLNPALSANDLTVVVPKGVTVHDGLHVGSNPAEQIDFGAAVTASQKSVLPVSTIGAFSTKEIWTIVHGAPPYANDGCFDGTSGVTMADQISRSGLLFYEIKTIDKSTCPDLPKAESLPQFTDTMANTSGATDGDLTSVSTFVARAGAMKGATFTVYRNDNGSLTLIGESTKLWTIATGDLAAEDLQDLANSYAFMG